VWILDRLALWDASEGTEKVRFPSIPLISVPSGRFPRARLQPIEQRRVRFAVFLRSLQKLRHPSLVLPTLTLLVVKAVLRDDFSCGVFSQGRVNFLFLSAVPAGVAALHYNQLVLTIKKNFFSGFGSPFAAPALGCTSLREL